jgi:hypothetical protein
MKQVSPTHMTSNFPKNLFTRNFDIYKNNSHYDQVKVLENFNVVFNSHRNGFNINAVIIQKSEMTSTIHTSVSSLKDVGKKYNMFHFVYL